MEKRLALDYFYGDAAEQFVFYRIPKVLFTDPYYKDISSDAKILYGLLLDRMSLSVKNHWVDDKNRVYVIFAIEEIMEKMGCGNQKAIKILAELDGEKGIGLIEKKRQGLGRPNLIYVKNFLTGTSQAEKTEDAEGVQKCENHTSGNVMEKAGQVQPVRQKCENHISGIVKQGCQEVCFSQGSKKELKETDQSKTPSIHRVPAREPPGQQGISLTPEQEYRAYETVIRNNIQYQALILDHPQEKGQIDEIVALLTEICCTKKDRIRIGSEERPAGVVRSKLLHLTPEHIRYVMECLRKNTTEIRNIRQYLLTVLYHAPETIRHYYAARVNHDLYGQK